MSTMSRTEYISDLNISAKVARIMMRDARKRNDAADADRWNVYAKRCKTVEKFVTQFSAAQFAIFKLALATSNREPYDFVIRCLRNPATMRIFLS